VSGPIEMSEEKTAAYTEWFKSLGDKIVDSGNPFNPKAEAKIANGIVESSPDSAAGYTIVKAESLQSAIDMAMTCPMANAPGCAVKVYETMPM
jgi:hypothetical protein